MPAKGSIGTEREYNYALYLRNCTSKEFMEMLRDKGFNYVYIKSIDDGFMEDYADLFEEGALVDVEHVYKVNNVGDGRIMLSFVK